MGDRTNLNKTPIKSLSAIKNKRINSIPFIITDKNTYTLKMRKEGGRDYYVLISQDTTTKEIFMETKLNHIDEKTVQNIINKGLDGLLDEILKCGDKEYFKRSNLQSLFWEFYTIPSNANRIVTWAKSLTKEQFAKVVDIIIHDEILEKLINIDPDIVFNASHDRLVSKPVAAQFDQYKSFFTIYCKNCYSEELKKIAFNPEATRFPEYRDLFDDKYYVREFVALNPKATRFPEYVTLFPNEKTAIACNPEAVKLKEYLTLFDQDFQTRRLVACNPNARSLPRYKELIPPEFGFDANVILKNPGAMQFPEFDRILEDEGAADCPELYDYLDISRILNNPKIMPMYVGKMRAPILDNHPELFSHSDRNVWKALLNNPEVLKSKNFKMLFSHPNIDVLIALAGDPEVVTFPEYRDLFKQTHTWVLEGIAENKKAAKLPEFKHLFDLQDEHIKQNLIDNPAARKFPEIEKTFDVQDEKFRIALAEDPKMARFDAYRRFFSDPSEKVRVSILSNPEAVRFPEYKTLVANATPQELIGFAKNPHAPEFKIFEDILFNFQDPEYVSIYAVNNKNAVTHPAFKKLLTETPHSTDFFELYIHCLTIANAAANPKAVHLPEFKQLFKLLRFYKESACFTFGSHMTFFTPFGLQEDQDIFLEACKQSPQIDPRWVNTIYKAIELITDSSYSKFSEQNGEMKEVGNFYFYIAPIVCALAANPEAPKLPEYREFFTFFHENCSRPILQVLANPNKANAPGFIGWQKRIMQMINEGKILDDYTNDLEDNAKDISDESKKDALEIEIVERVVGIDYIYDECKPNEEEKNIEDEEDDAPDQEEPNAHEQPDPQKDTLPRPITRKLFYSRWDYNYQLAKLPEAVVFDEYSWFFDTKDSKLVESICENPVAIRHPEFKTLFNNEDVWIRIDAYRAYYNHLNEQFRRFGIPPSAENTPKVQACEKIAEQLDTVTQSYQKEQAILPQYEETIAEVLKSLDQWCIDPATKKWSGPKPTWATDPLEQLDLPKSLYAQLQKELPHVTKAIQFKVGEYPL
jgi:hypothetical protein